MRQVRQTEMQICMPGGVEPSANLQKVGVLVSSQSMFKKESKNVRN
jgi:hypothetical protein